MQNVERYFTGDARAFTLPILETIRVMSHGQEKSLLQAGGMAIIQNNKLIDYLDSQSQLGIRFMKPNELGRNITLTHKEKNGKITVKIIRTKSDLKPMIEDNRWKMKVKVRVYGEVIQNSSSLDLMGSNNSLMAIEGLFNKDIKKVLEGMMHQLQKQVHADVVGFAWEFHKHYPREWNKIRDNWNSVFPNVDTEIDVQTSIERPGISNLRVQPKTQEKRPAYE
jgi:spore germination protein KC